MVEKTGIREWKFSSGSSAREKNWSLFLNQHRDYPDELAPMMSDLQIYSGLLS